GLQVAAKGAHVVAIRRNDARDDVEQGDVVIAGHSQNRRPEPGGEAARRRKLSASRALCNVAREHNELRAQRASKSAQGVHDVGLLCAEVRIGYLQQRAHHAERTISGTMSIRRCGEIENRSGEDSQRISPSIATLTLSAPL